MARGQNEGRSFRGWLPRARIYRKNERVLARGVKRIERIEGHSARGIRNKNSKFELLTLNGNRNSWILTIVDAICEMRVCVCVKRIIWNEFCDHEFDDNSKDNLET